LKNTSLFITTKLHALNTAEADVTAVIGSVKVRSSERIKKPGALFLEKDNPAVRGGPVAFRPHLAMGLAKKSRL
jgi:hypothetical protein